MKKLLLSMFVVIPFYAFAQSEVQGDTLKNRLPIRMEQETSSPIGNTLRYATPVTDTKELQGLQTEQADTITLRITPPEYVEELPWMEFRPHSLHNPFEMDYERYADFLLSPQVILDTYSSYNTYPTMGAMMEAGVGLSYYSPNERWELNGGLYAAKYTLPSRMHGAQIDLGLNASLAYRINDYLRVRTFGQYSGYGKSNSLNGYMNPMYPQSGYGIVMEVKVTDWLEIHGGVERVYDPTKMKWTTVPMLYPVINIKKKK